MSVFLVFCVLASLFSFMMFISERQFWISSIDGSTYLVSQHDGQLPPLDEYYQSPFSFFPTCIWFTIVTMTTLGYGDITPVAWQGRLFAAISVLSGCVTISLMVGVLTNKLSLDMFETRVTDWLSANSKNKIKQQRAAALIQKSWKESKKLGLFKSKDSTNVQQSVWKNRILFHLILRPYIKRFQESKAKLKDVEERWAKKLDTIRVERDLQFKMNRLFSKLNEVQEILKVKAQST